VNRGNTKQQKTSGEKSNDLLAARTDTCMLEPLITGINSGRILHTGNMT
jgi:hypothetical protein